QEVKVIGINDYYFIDGYERVMQYKKHGRLGNIDKIFSVLEFRIDTFGSGNENNLQKINLHIIFNIEETNLEKEIQKIKKEFIELIPITKLGIHLTKTLSRENLAQEGNNDLQKGFSDLIPSTEKVFELLDSPTWKDKCFLLLGYKEWSNLEKNNQLKPLKENLFGKVNAFFTSNHETYNKSKMWLEEYGDKPLLHSLDIHDFTVLDTVCKDRNGSYKKPSKYFCNTWIKADPTFDGLRQIIYEPKNRVFIGAESPNSHRENCINAITVEKKWFPQKTLPLNNGLVSIIGARGSGKTALLDFIALSTDAYNTHYKYKAGFLSKAENEVQTLVVKSVFDGQEISRKFDPRNEDKGGPLVQYLSQQFVENLCSEEGSNENLQAEIERFIFDSIDDVERMGTSNFSELKAALCWSAEQAINSYETKISELNKEISQIHSLQTADLPNKYQEKDIKKAELENLQGKLPKLNKDIRNKSLDDFEKISSQKIKLESELKLEQSQYKELEQIFSEVADFNKTISAKSQDFKDRLSKFNFDEKKLSKFDIQYPESLLDHISGLIEAQKSEFNKRLGSEKSPIEGTYKYLKQRLTEIQKDMNTYTENERYYLEISKKIAQTNVVIKEIEVQIKKIEELSIEKLQKERLKMYQQIFGEFSKKKAILESLYKPLIDQLKNNEQEKQLGFFVKINVNIKSWAKQGEDLIDLRRAKDFSDHERLYSLANDKLLKVWEDCNVHLIGKAIEDFINNEVREMRKYLIKTKETEKTLIDLANWLFSTNHISISYEMTFNDVPLKRLSPGTKGVLLMLLYLGVDKNDTRPLLIDQPEDNLDPESVFNVLVPYFIEAKKRRQIIMVTHNPNLVVATDSDQVIVAKITPKDVNQLPIFTYSGGGLENPAIIDKICSILEGGEDAFLKREKRYFSRMNMSPGGKINA
ncbi:MAG: AAA family ATPase, partial [Prevotellaceae bacterium]|nr:AAA family ATPase [Prevotellaceae bacterium]